MDGRVMMVGSPSSIELGEEERGGFCKLVVLFKASREEIMADGAIGTVE
jgi:hypothetical protein